MEGIEPPSAYAHWLSRLSKNALEASVLPARLHLLSQFKLQASLLFSYEI